MSHNRKLHFLSLAEHFPDNVRARLRIAIEYGEPLEFVRDGNRLSAEIGGVHVWAVWVPQEQPSLVAAR